MTLEYIYIVIPVYNRLNYTTNCIGSLVNQTFKNFKIILVDHGSTDGTREIIKEKFPEVIILKGDESMWWTAATNFGISYSLEHNAEYILTLNNDLVVEPNYLTKLYSISLNNPNSIIGSTSVDIKNSQNVHFAGNKWNSLTAKYTSTVSLHQSYLEISKNNLTIDSDFLPGRGTLIPTKVFRTLGLFDDKNFPHYMADEDFSLRCKTIGYNCIVSTEAVVFSHVSDTGLNKTKNTSGFKYWKDFFLSIRSPNNITYRWRWAKRHAKLPLAYLLLDYGRVIASQLIKSHK